MFKKKYLSAVDQNGEKGSEEVAVEDVVPIPVSGSSDAAINLDSSYGNEENFVDEVKGDAEEGSGGSKEEPHCYPADCYSFMSIHGPTSPFFYFGFVVWVFQVAFLIVMVINVIHPKLSTNENDDNPDAEDGAFWAYVIPANAGTLSKVTQFLALISYCVFADESLKDICTAVETFPNFRKAKPGDKVGLIATSCLLRLTQGALASFVVWLLVANTVNIVDIILNFTAVNFISAFDDIAFELAQQGRYGDKMKAEADRIEELPTPACMVRKNGYSRYLLTVMPTAFVLLTCMTIVTIGQQSSDIWLTKKLRVQFKDDPLRAVFNGCYKEATRVDRRVVFESEIYNEENATFGYCQSAKKWYLYRGNSTTKPCDVDFIDLVAYSTRTYLFDFSGVAEETWYSRTGTPLELYYFDDNKNKLDDDECASFLGDGKCDPVFNLFDHNYDDGDCCASTCEGLNCGQGALATAFGTNVTSGNGFPHCKNPDMVPITIKLNNVYVPTEANFGETPSPFELPPRDPLMIMDCDDHNVFMVPITGDMKFKTETLYVADGADCVVTVKNTAGGIVDINFVNYTVYHGTSESIEIDPIVIFHGDSFVEGRHAFKRVPECYFDKLSDYIDVSTIYTGDTSAHKAIEWLLKDSDGYSNCEYDTFIERYALATVNYAAPNVAGRAEDGSETDPDSAELWINTEMHCVWANVACVDDSVVELDLAKREGLYLSGTLATEIGLLKNINWLEFGYNDMYGSIPTEIGQWTDLQYFGVDYANLSGPLPSEMGQLKDFQFLIINHNAVSGTIPTEIGQMDSLVAFVLGNNDLTGSIPNEFGELTDLEFFFVGNNTMTGTLPTVFGLMPELLYISGFGNEFEGAIPSEIGQLTRLAYIQLSDNDFTGSIPAELFSKTYTDFDFFGNPLSGLSPREGQEICDVDSGEIYCNCASDCTFRPHHCQCGEAQSCCADFLSQYSKCLICPTEGLSNPNYWVEDYLSTCEGIGFYIENSLIEFGTERLCYEGKMFFQAIGCGCVSADDEVGGDAEQLLSGEMDV